MHPHADAVAFATTASLAAWLTYPAVAATTVNNTSSVQVISGTETVASEPDTVSLTPVEQTSPVQSASSDFLPLGIFGLKASPSSEATRAVELFVDRNGNLRGSQIDLISEGVEEVQGTVDKASQFARWAVGPNTKTVFEAPVQALTQTENDVTVRFSNGRVETWQLVRLPPQ